VPLAALEDQAWMRANVDRVRATRARLTRALVDMATRFLPSQAELRPCACVRAGSQAGVAAALREQGVLVRHFAEVPPGPADLDRDRPRGRRADRSPALLRAAGGPVNDRAPVQ
jgi:histidinol-phosphate/aromatic aminotransferase/cobyric acid decarboxylase-like protein